MHELEDRWILPIGGGTVKQCCINHGITIAVESDGAAESTILISGGFDLRTADGSWSLDPAGKAVELAPVLRLLELTVEHAAAYKNGTLEIVFASDARLRIPPDAAYEAWEFDGSHGAKAIGLPGGEVAIWRPAA